MTADGALGLAGRAAGVIDGRIIVGIGEIDRRGRLVDGYCFGNNDFIDRDLIAFLRTLSSEETPLRSRGAAGLR